MKKFVLILFVLLNNLLPIASKNLYYYYNGERIDLSVCDDSIKIYSVAPKGTGENAYISSISTNQQNIGDRGDITSKEYLIKGTGNSYKEMSNRFYVQLYDSIADVPFLHSIAEKTKTILVGKVPNIPDWYELVVHNSTIDNSLEMSNYFYETGLFKNVDPGFIFNFRPSCVTDTHFSSQQWGMASINICPAWNITKGSSDVKIAIVDKGVYPEHPEFSTTQFTDYYNCYTGSTSLPYTIYGAHGTFVCGIIASNHNSGRIAGVAPDCKIMPISHHLYGTETLSAELASGISWAVNHGASVINCSWGDQGGNLYDELHSSLLESSIQNALTNGRNGKGCVVVFASGNQNSNLDYPAYVFPNIMAVGATNSLNTRASFSSYGPALDIVAPGVDIYSTKPYADYDSDSGTSYAAPMVAGVAALMLSANPLLSRSDVIDIIESTAQKVGNYNYTTNSNRPNGTWNNEMGYGLVDAYGAVTAAKAREPFIEGTHYLCDSTYQYVRNVPEGASIHWSISPSQGTVIRFGILGDNNKDSVLIGDVMAIARGNGGNDSAQSRVFPSTPFDPPFPPFPPLITTDSTRTLSVTVSHSGVSYTTQKILYHPNFYGTPQIWASDSATAWTLREWRHFAIQNCQEVPDSLLRWEIYLVRSASDSLVYAKTGRTMKYRPFRGGIYYVIAYNDDNVCGTASSSKTYSVSPSPLDALGNEDDEISQEQEESKEPSVPSMPQRHIPAPSSSTTKTLRDGQLYILREGKTYTATGQEVK